MRMWVQNKNLRRGILITCIFVVFLIIIEKQNLEGGYRKATEVSYELMDKLRDGTEILKNTMHITNGRYILNVSRNIPHGVGKTTISSRNSMMSTREATKSKQQNFSTTSSSKEVTSIPDKVLLEKENATSTRISAKRSKDPVKSTPKKKFTAEEAEKIRQDVVDWFTIKNESLKDDRLNRHNFVFKLDSKQCSRKNISLLIVVHSAVQYGSKRQRIRDTWSSVANSTYPPVVVFMIGEESPSSNLSLQKYVELESKTYGDIVQGDFVDSYRNLSYKHVMAIHWITSRCHDVRTIVKIDDDVFIDIYKLGNFSLKSGYIQNSLYCHVFKNEKPKRAGKWGVSKEMFPFDLYPKCCEGMAYIMSMDVARKLIKASETMRFFWIDDAFVTGMLARKANVTHTSLAAGHKTIKSTRALKLRNFKNLAYQRYMFFVHFQDWNYLMKYLFAI